MLFVFFAVILPQFLNSFVFNGTEYFSSPFEFDNYDDAHSHCFSQRASLATLNNNGEVLKLIAKFYVEIGSKLD